MNILEDTEFVKNPASVIARNFRLIDDRLTGNYIHVQDTPTDTWVINHGLGRYPTVTIVDSANQVFLGDVEYTSLDVVTIRFLGSFSGRAFIN